MENQVKISERFRYIRLALYTMYVDISASRGRKSPRTQSATRYFGFFEKILALKKCMYLANSQNLFWPTIVEYKVGHLADSPVAATQRRGACWLALKKLGKESHAVRFSAYHCPTLYSTNIAFILFCRNQYYQILKNNS